MPKQEIVIGILDDLSGPSAATGIELLAGFQDALRYFNEEKGGIEGHPLRAIVIDFKMDGSLAITGWDRLKTEGVPAILSGLAGLAPVLIERANSDKIPLISGGGTFDTWYPTGPSYFFLTTTNQYSPFAATADMIEEDWAKTGEKRAPRVAFDVISLGSYKTIFSKSAKIVSEKKGWEYLITNSPPNPADVTTQALQVKNFRADYLDLHVLDSNCIVWLKELDRQNFHPRITGYTWLGSEAVWRGVGTLAVGVKFFQTCPLWTDTDVPGVKLLHELTAKWYPQISWRSGNHIRGFIQCLALIEGLGRAVDNVGYDKLDGEAMKTALETIRDYDPMGMGMGFTWTPTDRTTLNGVKFYQWTEGGGQKPVSDWYRFEPLPQEWRTDAFWRAD